MSGPCPEKDKYLYIIRQLLDQESNPDDEKVLYKQLEECACCVEQYELEQQIRLVLKRKLEGRPLPHGLAKTVKSKIAQSKRNDR